MTLCLRQSLPVYVQPATATTFTCEVRENGAIVTPLVTGSSASIIDPAGTVLLAPASITVPATVATYVMANTIIPVLKNFEQILEAKFFVRFGLDERGVFDLAAIPELQESEDQQSKRDIAEIQSGLKTINEVLAGRGVEPKPWGDIWYRPKNLVPTGDGSTPTKSSPRRVVS